MNLKISQLTQTNAIISTDLVTVVDVNDKSMASSGTNKKMTLKQFAESAIPSVSNETINGSKIIRGTITADRLAPGVIPTITNQPGQIVDTTKIDTALADLNARLSQLKNKITPGTQLYADEIGANIITTFNLYADKVTANTVLVGDLSARVGEIGTLYTNLLETVNLKASTAAVGNLYATTANVVSLLADYVKTDKLVTEIATINTAIIKKATITDLDSAIANINDLRADVASVNSLVAQKATFTDLVTERGRITTLNSNYVTVDGKLTASNAKIANLETDYVTVSSKLTAAEGEITTLKTKRVTTDDLQAATGRILKLESNSISTGNFEAYSATITRLEADVAKIANLETDYVTVSGKLTAAEGEITTLKVEKATLADLVTERGRITTLNSNYVTVDGNLTAANAKIANLETGVASINTLVAQKATFTDLVTERGRITTLNSNYVTVDGKLTASNAKIDKLETGVASINTLYVKTANIDTLIANNADVKGKVTATEVAAQIISAKEATFDILYAKQSVVDELVINKTTVNDLIAKKVTADQVDTIILNANLVKTDTLIAKVIESDIINSRYATINAIQAGGITAGKIAAGSVGIDQLNNTIGSIDTLSSKFIMATNIASSNFNGQVITDELGNVTSINVGDKGYYMDAASGTMIVNKLVAREGVISGKYIQFNKEGAFTVDSAGNLDVQVDTSTIGITAGKISILKVPSTSIVTVTQDINYIGGCNNTIFTPITTTNGRFHYGQEDLPGLAGPASPGPTKSDIIMRWDILANPGGIDGPTYFSGGKLHNFSMILNYANIKNATNATGLEIALYVYWSDNPDTLTNSPNPTKTSLGVVTAPVLKLGDNTYTFPPIDLPMPEPTNRYLLFVPSVVIKANNNTSSSYTTSDPGVTATATVAGTATAWTITKALSGSGYSNAPIVTITGGTKTVVGTASAKLGLTNKSFTISNPGNKVYSVAPTVTITGGSPSVAATATAILTSGVVTGINITNMGDGYGGNGVVATFSGGTSASGTVSPTAVFNSDEYAVSTITKLDNGTYTVKPTAATLSAPPPRNVYSTSGFDYVVNGVVTKSTIGIRIPANITMALTVSATGTITSFSNQFSKLLIASGTKLSIP
jgi:hypothetical protein